MAGPILPISPAALPSAIRPAGTASSPGAFQDVFSSAVQQVESLRTNASASVERFLSGEGEELHTAVMATNRAELSFDLFLQTRNKVVGAYQEIMKMQL
ncbi:MAG TPA: flagellar hook-basal body complex protein FliE [Candidatus Sulfopaludibacter sp.]|jgi:flagellar hook-basal body complex protein FliE|nr:flagellar hook-basal body complex protein FliE [Candidatus Sulfopaludibacter sp.]